MNYRKRYFFTFLFLVYFLLYVVSPLCYANDRLSEGGLITHSTKHNTPLIPPLSRGELKGGVRVIWELILSGLFQKENPEDRGPDVHFLIKKARAVLSSSNILKTAQQESESSYLSNFNFSGEVFSPLSHSVNIASQKGFYRSFSGLSPPRV